ncbi:MAG TPA: class I SAM-dependent methyltransferase [Natronosporangium sp.]|nr:class I SAM-dependent methyltransferase [Natronosporangium sp.]
MTVPSLLPLTDEVRSYSVRHSTPLDAIANELIEETRALLPDRATMQLAPEHAGLLTLLTRLLGVRHAVEVGTFTGMSSLAIARGMADGGRLTCFDISDEYTSVARRYWERAGVADRIDLRIGPAAERLRELPAEPYLDLAFIDADKGGYSTYWAELVPRVRPGGLLVVDNVLWHGTVVDPPASDPNAQVLAQFNTEVAADDRVDLVMLPIGDGLTLARRR